MLSHADPIVIALSVVLIIAGVAFWGWIVRRAPAAPDERDEDRISGDW